jgi:hypothetical protein
MNYEEIGKRFVEICEKLDNMGVFYGNNYSGKYHEKYPHSSYWFALHLDKHHGGFESILYNDCEIERTFAMFSGDDETNPATMIIDVLEKTYDVLVEEDCLGDAD